jgi:hypothetical protein
VERPLEFHQYLGHDRLLVSGDASRPQYGSGT